MNNQHVCYIKDSGYDRSDSIVFLTLLSNCVV